MTFYENVCPGPVNNYLDLKVDLVLYTDPDFCLVLFCFLLLLAMVLAEVYAL